MGASSGYRTYLEEQESDVPFIMFPYPLNYDINYGIPYHIKNSLAHVPLLVEFLIDHG